MIIAILGATRGMGRALARAAAARGDQLILLGRGLDELQRSAADLTVRAAGAQAVATIACDLAAPAGFGPALDAAWARARPGRRGGGHRRPLRHPRRARGRP
jgi:decaprenylphospho-beta-D-erythro-pentofuranosid-2-ulose 2-reductase